MTVDTAVVRYSLDSVPASLVRIIISPTAIRLDWSDDVTTVFVPNTTVTVTPVKLYSVPLTLWL